MAVFQFSQLGANFRFDFLGVRRRVAEVFGGAFAIRYRLPLLVELRGELLNAAAEDLRFRRLRGELVVELADAIGQIVGAPALLGKLLFRRLELGGLAVEVIPQRLSLFLVAVDLALQRLGLRAQRHQLHALAARRDGGVVEVGGDLDELGPRARERALRFLERDRLGGELGLRGLQVVGELLFLGFERKQRGGLLAELEFEAADRFAFPAEFCELVRRFRLHLLDAHLEAAHGHGEFGAQLILVGLNFRDRQRGESFEAAHGEAYRARVHQWNNADNEQARDQKPDPDIHDLFDHDAS